MDELKYECMNTVLYELGKREARMTRTGPELEPHGSFELPLSPLCCPYEIRFALHPRDGVVEPVAFHD